MVPSGGKLMSQNQIWSLRVPGKLILIGLMCTGAALAQVAPVGPQTKPADTIPEAANKTRARKVVKPDPEKSKDAAADPPKTAEKLVETPAEKPAEKVVEKPVEKLTTQATEDPSIAILRDEIDAATAPADRTRLRLQLADRLAEAGMKTEAIAELHLLVGEDRFDPSGCYNIGNRLVRLGDAPGAIEAYHKAIDQRQGNYSRALNNLGFVLLQEGQWDQSYDALVAALRLEGFRYAEASYNLGRLYAARGETDLAMREWRRALAVDPQHAGAALALRDNRGAGNVTIAAKPVGQPVGQPAGKPARLPASSDRVSPDKPRAAVATRTVTVDQKTYDLLQRARNDRDHGHNEEAVVEYRNVLAHLGGYFAPANLELAFSLTTLRRNDQAITSLLAVSANDGAHYPIVYFHLARLYEMKGELKLAEENFSRAAVAYAGDNVQFLLDLSRVREKLGDFSGALAALEQYVQATASAGHRPDWVDERLPQLRQKATGLSAVTTKN
jgi:tetratricopeptide (TPR) repeat protein